MDGPYFRCGFGNVAGPLLRLPSLPAELIAVDGELAGREPAQAGVFRVSDPVLDPGMGPMPGLEELQPEGGP